MNLEPQPTPPTAFCPAPRVIGETREWVALEKPSGWLSVPGRSELPVLLDWVRALYPEALTVHRLDVQTSGVILFARGAEAHRRASLWFQNREVRKQYVCLASGRASLPILKIQKPIEGMHCSTQVEVLSQFAEGFHARIRPLSGKRHQIRIHLAGEGYPLLGDPRYGGPCTIRAGAASLEIARVALHAELLELPSGERFTAALAEDFSRWLGTLEEGRK